jgi:hypothetical protein
MTDTTIGSVHSGPDASYYGDHSDWIINVELGIHRDSATIYRSNYTVLQNRLYEIDADQDDWHTESSSHWAVGWTENVVVRPQSKAHEILQQASIDIENYPLLDEEHYSELEHSEASDYWDSMSMEYRISDLDSNNESIFAARSDYYDLIDRAPRTAQRLTDQ